MIYTQVVPASHLTPACHPPCPPRSWPFPRTTQWPWGQTGEVPVSQRQLCCDLRRHHAVARSLWNCCGKRTGELGFEQVHRECVAGEVGQVDDTLQAVPSDIDVEQAVKGCVDQDCVRDFDAGQAHERRLEGG